MSALLTPRMLTPRMLTPRMLTPRMLTPRMLTQRTLGLVPPLPAEGSFNCNRPRHPHSTPLSPCPSTQPQPHLVDG